MEGTEEWRDAQRLRAYALVFLGRLEDADAASVAAIGDVSADITSREMVQLVTARMIRLLFGDSDLPATLELVERASTTSPTAHALALHCAGLAFAASDPGAALEYQRASCRSECRDWKRTRPRLRLGQHRRCRSRDKAGLRRRSLRRDAGPLPPSREPHAPPGVRPRRRRAVDAVRGVDGRRDGRRSDPLVRVVPDDLG